MLPALIPLILGHVAQKAAPKIIDAVVDRIVKDPANSVTQADAPAIRKELVPVIEHLTNGEPWYKSRVTWGAIGAIFGGIGTIATALANGDYNPEMLGTAALSVLGGFGTLYGRWAAKPPVAK